MRPYMAAKVRRDDYFVDLITGMSNAVFSVDESWILIVLVDFGRDLIACEKNTA